MSSEEQQSKAAEAAARRFETIEKGGGLSLDAEAGAIDAAVQALEIDPELGLLRLWNALRYSAHPLAARTLSFLLAQRLPQRPVFAEMVLLDLMSRRDNDDNSTLLNLTTAAGGWFRSGSPTPQALYAGLPSFLLRILRKPEMVKNAALDLLVTMAGANAFGAMPAYVNTSLVDEIGTYVGQHARDDVGFVVSRAQGQGLAKEAFLEGVSQAMQGLANELRRRQDAAGQSEVLQGAVRYLQRQVVQSRALATSSRVGSPVKAIRVADESRSPPFDVVSAVLEKWLKFFEAGCEALELSPVVRPLEAAPGSFVINAAVEGASDPERILERLRQLVQADAGAVGGVLEAQAFDAKIYRNLLETLAQHQASLEVTIVDAQQEALYPPTLLTITFAAAKAVLPPVRQVAATRRLETDQIPQADDIGRVFRLVELLNEGEGITPQSLDVSLRQVNYYKHAARVLGLLSEENILTSAGGQVARLNAQERRMSTAVLFEESDCGAAWLRWSKVSTLAELDPDTAGSFITHVVPALSAVTARRRAQTLAAWQRELAPFHYTRWRVR